MAATVTLRALTPALLMTLTTLAAAPLRAQDSAAAPVLRLWPRGAPDALGTGEEDEPTITVFRAPRATTTGTAVVVFPGGGYQHLATEKEGTTPAAWLNSLGVSAFVVRYRLGPKYHHPTMLRDAQRAVRTVRARAAEWGVDPARVGVMGFSAGGHLAASAGTLFADSAAAPARPDAIDRASARPDFMVLVYPVVTLRAPFAHAGSRLNLLGAAPDSVLVRQMSLETRVAADTPPAFLVATSDDATVPVENTLLLYQALHAAGVPVEMHVYETGHHGFGLAPNDPLLADWTQRCAAWLRHRGLLAPTPSH